MDRTDIDQALLEFGIALEVLADAEANGVFIDDAKDAYNAKLARIETLAAEMLAEKRRYIRRRMERLKDQGALSHAEALVAAMGDE